MNNQEKGLAYEKYIVDYVSEEGKSWLWNNIPEKHLIKSGFINDINKNRIKRKLFLQNPNEYTNPLRDTGIDALLKKNKEYVLIQCKNGYKKGLTIENLAGFFCNMVRHRDKEGRVYHTSKLSTNLRETCVADNVKFIKKIMDDVEDDSESDTDEEIKYNLYDYQQTAVKQLIKHYKKNNRGILSAPCGTGKTIMGCFLAHEYDCVILLSPLKQFAEQNSDRYKQYFNDYCPLLIDSDGTRDIEEIKKFIKKKNNKNNKKKLLFSCTFKSVDVVNQFIEFLPTNTIVIIDEFHNLSRNNIVEEEDEMNKLLVSDATILFQSATPRVYDLENTDDDEEHTDIFGDIVYHMDFKTAIEKNYVCDYKIYLPSVSEDKSEFIEEIEDEININNINDDLRAKCMYFYKCMLHNGTKKCIVYMKNIEETEQFKKCLKKFDEYYATNLLINTITSNDKHANDEKNPEVNSREWKLKQFKETDRMTVILSVKILDECVDIKECDSIFITYPSKSKIRNVQRMCRCMRKNGDDKHKIGSVYLWCDEYEEILETLSGLKEYDSMFKDKIKLVESNYNYNKKNTNDGVVSKKDKETIDNYLVDVKEYKRLTWNESCKLLFQFCDEFEKCPSKKYKYKTKNIGIWYRDQKRLINNNNCDLYIKLSRNTYVKNSIDKYLLNKEKNQDKIILSQDEKIKLLIKYYNINKKCPQQRETYEGQNIGMFLCTLKKQINNNDCNSYKKLAQNSYIKSSIDKYLLNKEKNKEKKKILSKDEKIELLIKYCNINKKCPTAMKTYEGQNIGMFLCTLKKQINNKNCNLYVKLSQNTYVKNSIDKYLLNKEKNKEKKILSQDEKFELLIKYCNINKKCPTQIETYEGQNIGTFLFKLKEQINNDCDLYKKITQNIYIKNSIDKYLSNKEKNKEKKTLSQDEKFELLMKYCDINKKCPQQKESYEGQNIGMFLCTLKKQINNKNCNLYVKSSQNTYVKNSIDKYLLNKEKNKEKKILSQDEKIELLIKYCNINKKCPTKRESHEGQNIGIFLCNLKTKIKNNTCDLYIKLSHNKYVKQSLNDFLEKKNIKS
jgi:superfamily II DNA or RNA helicase